MRKKEEGITLVALVITVIVMLILAGVTVNLIIGDNGIFKKSNQGKEIYEEQAAKERLEMAIGDLVLSKYKDSEYNEHDYIDKTLASQNITIVEEIAIVDGWLFEVDRSVPKVGQSLGKGQENKEIQIKLTPTISSDYVNGNLKIEVTYDKEISQIIVKGEKVEIPEAVEGVYKINKEIIENGTHTVIVKDAEGNYKIGTIEISGLTEDMEIWNKEDMNTFREKVEEGRTFEKRTVKVMSDIDLEGSKENQWIPIGRTTNTFLGTLEGNNHTISNLYINVSSGNNQGLFAKNDGTIQNVKVEGEIIASKSESVAGIAGENKGKIINCHNYIKIQGYDKVGGITGLEIGKIYGCSNQEQITGYTNVGGIVGCANSKNCNISVCLNKGDIKATSQTAGGICGYTRSGNIYNCYNIGQISSIKMVGGINGAAGRSGVPTVYTYNCYNIGSISGSANTNQITGYPSVNGGTSKDINCYTTNATATGLNAGEYSENIWIEDVQKEDETWKYNNGYPILKWQLENLK